MPETAPKLDNKVSKKTALIAGGAGFVGSHLATTLISQNLKVIAVDNLSTGKRDNLKEILTHPDFTFIEADINDQSFQLPPEVKIDYCFHLASIEDYQGSKHLSLDTLLVNSLGTRVLLEIAKAQGAKFILASSADLYSGAISNTSLRHYFGKTPEAEAVLSVHEAKRFAEALAFEYFSKFNLPVTILRLKDAYGPKMNLDRGDEIAELLKQTLNRQVLQIKGDGLKTINPTYISDVVFGLVKAALGEYAGEIFVLVNSEKVTVESFAGTIKLVAGPVEIEHKDEKRPIDYSFHHFDLDNTRAKLNWNPKVSLAEGIGAVIQAYHLGARGQEPSVQVDNKIPQLAEPISLTGDQSQFKRKKVTSHAFGRWLRIIIFTASSLLLLLTVVYPIGGYAAKSYFGKGNLTRAFENFSREQNQPAQTQAAKAQGYLHAAQVDLQNVSWLLKMIGLSKKAANSDKLLFAGEDLALALSSFSRSSDIIVSTSQQVDLTKVQVVSQLTDSLTELESTQNRLEEVNLLLDSLDWAQLPQVISLKRDFMLEKTEQLSQEVNELVQALQAALELN